MFKKSIISFFFYIFIISIGLQANQLSLPDKILKETTYNLKQSLMNKQGQLQYSSFNCKKENNTVRISCEILGLKALYKNINVSMTKVKIFDVQNLYSPYAKKFTMKIIPESGHFNYSSISLPIKSQEVNIELTKNTSGQWKIDSKVLETFESFVKKLGLI